MFGYPIEVIPDRGVLAQWLDVVMLHGTPRAEPGLDEDDRNETRRGDEVVELSCDS